MLVVDTNILVYAADRDSPFHTRCHDWLERQRGRTDAWFTTWPILYEFLRVTTHPRVMRKPWNLPAAWSFVAGLLASPGLGVQGDRLASTDFPKFRLLWVDGAGAEDNAIGPGFDLGTGGGVHALSPGGMLLAVEMVGFKNNERHASPVDVGTGVEANLAPIEANTLPVLALGQGPEHFFCMTEDAEG